MKYKQFLEHLGRLKYDTHETIFSEHFRHSYGFPFAEKYAVELATQRLQQFDIQELKNISNAYLKNYEDLWESFKDLSISMYLNSMYLNRVFVLNKQLVVNTSVQNLIKNIQHAFDNEYTILLEHLSCRYTDFPDNIPTHNWRLSKVFKTKPAQKVNPKFVIEDHFIEKAVQIYFDMIRHGYPQ